MILRTEQAKSANADLIKACVAPSSLRIAQEFYSEGNLPKWYALSHLVD